MREKISDQLLEPLCVSRWSSFELHGTADA